MKNSVELDFPVGAYLAKVRDDAGLSQSQLAQAVTFSTATLSRIESGEKPASEDELTSMLNAIGTPKAEELREFLTQKWDQVARPTFDHPNRTALWQANLTLRQLDDLQCSFARLIFMKKNCGGLFCF